MSAGRFRCCSRAPSQASSSILSQFYLLARARSGRPNIAGSFVHRYSYIARDGLGPKLEISVAERRPIAARSSGWAKWLATRLARSPVTPNQISLLSILFAALGG